MSKRHFEMSQSNADRQTLLAAVSDVEGLDVAAAKAFLDTDELADEVWRSYGRTQKWYGITEIPVFSFNRPGVPSAFSPAFKEEAMPHPIIVIGSASIDIFEKVFDELVADFAGPPARL